MCGVLLPMKKVLRTTGPYPVTSVRLDPELVHRAKQLALDNHRDGKPENGFSKVVGAALAAYLKNRSA